MLSLETTDLFRQSGLKQVMARQADQYGRSKRSDESGGFALAACVNALLTVIPVGMRAVRSHAERTIVCDIGALRAPSQDLPVLSELATSAPLDHQRVVGLPPPMSWRGHIARRTFNNLSHAESAAASQVTNQLSMFAEAIQASGTPSPNRQRECHQRPHRVLWLRSHYHRWKLPCAAPERLAQHQRNEMGFRIMRLTTIHRDSGGVEVTLTSRNASHVNLKPRQYALHNKVDSP